MEDKDSVNKSKSMLALNPRGDEFEPIEEFKSGKQKQQHKFREDDEETVTSKAAKGKKKKGKKKKGNPRPEKDEFDEIPNIMEYDDNSNPKQSKKKL